MRDTTDSVRVRLVGGPTAVIEIGGLRLVTDPTFDPPGKYPVGRRVLVKTRGPATRPDELGAIDAVLLSHDQHPDNLDSAGRAFVIGAARVLTTGAAAARLGGAAEELRLWTRVSLARPDGGQLHVVGVPARHGPTGSEPITGPVMGFVLHSADLPTIYISGDNASLEVVEQVNDHLGPIEIAILFGGAARTPLLDAYLTMGSADLAQAAALLRPALVVPVHAEGWAHLTQDQTTLTGAFERNGVLDQLALLAPGEQITIPELIKD